MSGGTTVRITLLPGDGIGPQVTEAALAVLEPLARRRVGVCGGGAGDAAFSGGLRTPEIGGRDETRVVMQAVTARLGARARARLCVGQDSCGLVGSIRPEGL